MIRLLAMVAAAAVCPQKLDIDPPEWKEALINAAPGSKEQAALIEQLGFRKVPSGSDLIPEAECIEQPVVKGVDLLLAKLFSIKTHEAAWDAPDEPAQTIARTVTPAGKFPRKLRVVEEVHCPDGKETPTCKPARRTAIYALRGGRYVPE